MNRFLILLSLAAHMAAAEPQNATPITPTGIPATAGKIALLPYPSHVEWQPNTCTFSTLLFETGQLASGERADDLAAEFKDIASTTGLTLTTARPSPQTLTIVLRTAPASKIPQESYTLTVTPDHRVEISSSGFAGHFNALQTLRQLILPHHGAAVIPCCRIEDSPAFGLRGFMLDVGRYYLSPDFIKTLVRNLSRYKINTLHLHLTDDPAWRIQIDKYPQLTDAKNHWPTRRPGQHYTRDELRDLVDYCARLNVQIIPEIDMPGHSKTFTKAMGTPMQSERGLSIVKDIIDETAPLFPAPWFHIGSDEVRVTMQEFIPEAVKTVRNHGKTPIVWYPGHPADSETVSMCWGENEAGADLPASGRYIDSNGFYLDWMDSQSGVYQIWFQQPCGVPKGNSRALGSIMAVWCDAALSGDNRIIEQYPFYPCALTFAERIWKGSDAKRRDLMANLPQKGTPEWKTFSDFENRLIIHRDRAFAGQPFAYVKQADMEWRLIGPFDHKGRNDTSFEPEQTVKDEYVQGNRTLRWKQQPAIGGAIHIRHLYAMFNMHNHRYRLDHWPTLMSKDVGKEPGTCYAQTHIYSPKAQNVHLMFGLNGMWGHTGGYRTSRAPEQGSWDFSGGDIWLNGQRIAPPRWPFQSLPWTGWGKGRIEEAPLTQEGYFFRPPVPIHLKQGWNTILIRSVFGHWKGDNGERKWMYCCMPVLWDGIHYTEVPGLRYSAAPPQQTQTSSAR
ncbi:family 20 glycosylhydrolase [Akkermansia glycaniphila]|uniref:beta-N-acetylhexosaminidase n=1 Tax=Akkermansia glycaniphila TaxID=1679444 RepID=A0A1H6L3Y1_9BACT|nr:family 20 glycosylhydrolase [Akkermansia glycaniphila]SEH82953.1 beta-hexosaminidase [Akkermansia glycaniphila]